MPEPPGWKIWLWLWGQVKALPDKLKAIQKLLAEPKLPPLPAVPEMPKLDSPKMEAPKK